MSQEIIERVDRFARLDSARVNTFAIKTRRTKIQAIFAELTHLQRNFSKRFFERQMQDISKVDDVKRWNITGRFAFFLCGIYLASPPAGEMLVEFIEQVIRWLRGVTAGEVVVLFQIKKDFWTLKKEFDSLSAEACYSVACGNLDKADELFFKIRQLTGQMQDALRESEFNNAAGRELIKRVGV